MASRREVFIAPHVPRIPGLPSVPRRSTLRDKFPSFAPNIPIPTADPIPNYAEKLSAWQQQYPAMSDLEFLVINYLTEKKGYKIGREFEYQTAVGGGRTKYGGFIVDFLIRPFLILQPQGQRWHLQQPRDRARLRLEGILLAGRGYTVVYLWEDDLLSRPDLTIENALLGRSMNTFRNDL